MGTEPDNKKQQRAFLLSLVIAAMTAILNTLVAGSSFISNGSVAPNVTSELVAVPNSSLPVKAQAQLDRIEVKVDTIDDKVRKLEKDSRR